MEMQLIKSKDCKIFSTEKEAATKSICRAYQKEKSKCNFEKLIKIDQWHLWDKIRKAVDILQALMY